jgi:RNA polymerase sigma-70 factor (ECF subfamily)
MALRALHDVDVAEDVVQEVMLRALHAVTHEIAATDDRLGAFVGGIARHVIADTHRTARRTRTLEPVIHSTVDNDALTNLVTEEEARRVSIAIRRLRSSDQVIIRASFYEGLTPSEIAERVAEPVERVRKRKSRALARLRDVLMPHASHESPLPPSIEKERDAGATAQGGG